jgi:hypothetical protein
METGPTGFKRKKTKPNQTKMVGMNRLVSSVWFIILKKYKFQLVRFFNLKPNWTENDHL